MNENNLAPALRESPKLILNNQFDSGGHHRFYLCFQKIHDHCRTLCNYQIGKFPSQIDPFGDGTIDRERSLGDSENV